MSEALRFHGQALSGVPDGLVGVIGGSDSSAVVLTHKYDQEGAAFQHSRKLSGSFANRHSIRCVIPDNRDRRVDPLFIVLAVVLVFVESECPIGASIDTQLDRVCWLFGRILQAGTHWEDGTSANI